MILSIQDEYRTLTISGPDDDTAGELLDLFFTVGDFLGYHRESLEDAIFAKAEEIGDQIDGVGSE